MIERDQVTTDKRSVIKNGANDAIASSDPQYILKLVMSIVRVSVQTVKIVPTLPALGVG